MEELKPVVFKLGSEEYGININLVQEIEKVQTIVPVPNAPRFIKGIINLRGEVIPVFSLRRKFNMEEKQSEESKFINIKIGDKKIALEVDEVEEIHSVEASHIHEVPTIIKDTNTAYVDKVVNLDGRLILIINVKSLLSQEEQDALDIILKDK